MTKKGKILITALTLFTAFGMSSCAPTTTSSVLPTITLSEATVTLEEGQTVLLRATTSDNSSVTFISSNDNVATVNANGLVTAVGAGDCTITALSGDITATCLITVTPKPVSAVNGFKPFAKGGLLGGEGGDYYPVTVTAVGDNAVKFSGKGGLSWPDTVNNKEPDCMGGYYDDVLDLNHLKFTYKLDQDMNFTGDHWYFVAFENQKQLFNSWNGEDPVKTLFFMIGQENGKVYIQPHYRDVIELGEAWSYLGKNQGVTGSLSEGITVEFNKTGEGYEVYLNGELQIFDNINSPYITVTNDLFPQDKVYMMAGAHIGNPENQYQGEYAFTLGLDKTPSTIVNAESIAFTNATEEITAGDNKQLTATITPENTTSHYIKYKSSNTEVATVDATGKVTAIAPGEATITASIQGKTGTCVVTVVAGAIPVTSVSLDKTTLSVEQNATAQLTATVGPNNADNKNVTWTVVDGKNNVKLTPDTQDSSKVTVTGDKAGTCVVKATAESFSATCEVTVTLAKVNGFKCFVPGGLVNNQYYEGVSISAWGDKCVKFTGKGGTNWGDTTQNASTMGGYYDDKLDINGLDIYYSIQGWVDGGTNHWYYIALTNGAKDSLFGNTADSDGTLFFMFSYNNGSPNLNLHYVGEGSGWTNVGASQGVPAEGGEYSIKFTHVEGGYNVYMKNASQTEYTLQTFNGQSLIGDTLMERLFGTEQKAYLQAGAYVETFTSEWSFVLGLNK